MDYYDYDSFEEDDYPFGGIGYQSPPKDPLCEALFQALNTNNLALFTQHLDSGFSANPDFAHMISGRDPRFVRAGYSLLQSASVRGLTPFVAALLERGVDPNVPGSYNETALSRACDNAHVETIRTLLEGGASPRSRGWYERTPLMLVARRGDGKGLEALEVLLRGGPAGGWDLSEVDGDGKTVWDFLRETPDGVRMREALVAYKQGQETNKCVCM